MACPELKERLGKSCLQENGACTLNARCVDEFGLGSFSLCTNMVPPLHKLVINIHCIDSKSRGRCRDNVQNYPISY